MHRPGDILIDTDGRRYEVVAPLGEGGQGMAFLVRTRRGVDAVAKVFDPTAISAHPAIKDRTRELVRRRLYESHLGLAAAPRAVLEGPFFGYVAAVAPGKPLGDVAHELSQSLMTAMATAVGLASAVAALEALGLCHSDLSPNNVFVDVEPTGIARTTLIDIDNVVFPRGGRPPCLGTPLYMAPEVYAGRAPGIEADRFSLAVLICILLLGRHPVAGHMPANATTATQARALATTSWLERNEHEVVGGMPTYVLSRSLRRLLRQALAKDPSVRPRASEWVSALRAAMLDIWICGTCRYQNVNDADRDRCPCCGEPVPPRQLVFAAGRRLPLTRPSLTVGRALLDGGDLSLSNAHARFEYDGYRLSVVDTSRNGTFVFASSWLRLPPGQRIELRPLDVLRFGESIVGRLA